MTMDAATPTEANSPAAPVPVPSPVLDAAPDTAQDREFDWRNCWYPVSFLCDLPRDRPTAVSLYDEPLVLFFDAEGRVTCLRDRCPHRAARLSDGQVIDGKLECLYHGWQFGTKGRCVLIPQLYPDKNIPEPAHARVYPVAIRHEIVWVWAGDPDRADAALIPPAAHDDAAQVFSVTFQMDLPYDQTYLIENVIDVAHIHIAHHGVRGGGLRSAAKPLDFQILESGIAGIKGSYRSVGLVRAAGSPSIGGAVVEYVAPNLIRYASRYQDPALIAGLDLYSLPLGKNRCRLLYRKYSNFTSARERWKPRWMEHLTQCTILEQDMAVVVGQHAQIERAAVPLRDIWLPLKSSDRLVIEYRRWLDRFGWDLPFYRGFATSRNSGPDPTLAVLPTGRRVLHGHICATCGRVHRNLDRAGTALWVFAAAALLSAVMLDAQAPRIMLGFGAAIAAGLAVAARRLMAWF